MECVMCCMLYDEKKHIPRNLPCGHTFCELCLNQIIQVKGFIECPNCRKKMNSDVVPESLSKNFIALDLAIKQQQLQSKHQMCEDHSEFQLFFCEDCQDHLCTQCIIKHSGHKFVKQEHSVSLLKERLLKAKNQLNDIIEMTNQSIENAMEIKVYQEKYLKDQIELIDKEFDNLIEKINKKRESFKQGYMDIYTEYIQSLEIDIVVQQSISDQFAVSDSTIQETENILESTKVIKNDQLVNKIEEIEEQIKKQIKSSTVSQEKHEFEIPSIVFGSEIYGHINTIAYLDSYQPKICYFGNKNKILLLDLKLFEWRKYDLPFYDKSQFLGFSTAVSLKNDNMLLIGGGNSDQVFEVSIQNDIQITKKKSMPIARKEHCSVVFNDGSVMILGGYNMQKQEMLASCYLYKPKQDQWVELAPMNIPKCAFAASICSFGQFVYTFGGYDSQKRLNDIEKYTIATNTWEIISLKLPKHLSNCASINHPKYGSKDCIYVLGGGHDEGFLKEVYKFTSKPEYSIEVIAEMENGKDLRNKVVLSKHYLYTIGGNGYKTERLNLISRVWDTLPSYYPYIVDNLDSWACTLTYTNQSADSMLSCSGYIDKSNGVNSNSNINSNNISNNNNSNNNNNDISMNNINMNGNNNNQLIYQIANQRPQYRQPRPQYANNSQWSLPQFGEHQMRHNQFIRYNDEEDEEQVLGNLLDLSLADSAVINENELRASSNFYNYRYNFLNQ